MIPCLISLVLLAPVAHVGSPSRELKVMVIFAHPDEGEIYVGVTTALYTQLGHKVKFLSITNGDAGHFSMNPEDLDKRRFQEAMEAKRILNLAEWTSPPMAGAGLTVYPARSYSAGDRSPSDECRRIRL